MPPLATQLLLQQSVLTLQYPTGVSWPKNSPGTQSHLPLVQDPLQQSVAAEQLAPVSVQHCAGPPLAGLMQSCLEHAATKPQSPRIRNRMASSSNRLARKLRGAG